MQFTTRTSNIANREQISQVGFGRLDAIFVGIGLLTIGAGIFARLTLHML